ncbi:DUF305 domain-containing protein [Microbacterium pumilum]|uniref:DUF305 domain-containing protein n=1 Tax=Microbacterium pumilum TaxID=344165 RepID=A0ABN2T018_9MICO
MRSRVAVIGVIVAAAAAVAGISLAIAGAVGASTGSPTPSTSDHAAPEPVTATDFCYVEAMIFYRVEAADLARALLDKPDISAETGAFAGTLASGQAAELEQLRPWYVAWTGSRPLERPKVGPCAGHGSHTQMPGMPTPSQWAALIAAEGVDAERIFLELLIVQDTAMGDFASQVLAEDPHSRVRESAEQVVVRGTDDIAALEDLLAELP